MILSAQVHEAANKQVIKRMARLNMCDLAGSERQKQTHASGVRLQEASNINKGLLTLQKV
jgi:kinesin family protein 15